MEYNQLAVHCSSDGNLHPRCTLGTLDSVLFPLYTSCPVLPTIYPNCFHVKNFSHKACIHHIFIAWTGYYMEQFFRSFRISRELEKPESALQEFKRSLSIKQHPSTRFTCNNIFAHSNRHAPCVLAALCRRNGEK